MGPYAQVGTAIDGSMGWTGQWDAKKLEYIRIKCAKYRSFRRCRPGVRQGLQDSLLLVKL